ncbi:MAG TPA: HDOD domain-containing protein [Chromatiaceae bacterium]|nr:HDOD domain-containing protein [Chromatiaceae bacterium]
MNSNMETTSLSLEELKRFTPLNEAPPHILEAIARKAEWLQAPKNALLMDIGDTEESSIFLVKGNIRLDAADGHKRIIKHTDPAARSPLSRLRPSRYRITALTPVQYLKVDDAVLNQIVEEEKASEMISSHYLVEESGEGAEDADFSTQVLAHIYEDLHRNSLLLLSWQPVSLTITKRILAETESFESLEQIIMLDPILTIKTLRKASAPTYSDVEERLSGALLSLGIKETQRLAFMNLFRESCRPRTVLENVFRDAWEQCIAVSRLAGELAQEHGLTPVDTVAMAGLLHNIGKLTLISYAYNFYREVSIEELKECVRMFSKETGRMVLNHWDLPHYLVRGISDSFEWLVDHGGTEATLSDVLIAARLYTKLVRTNKALKEVPALRKLGLQDPRSKEGQAMQNLVIQAVAEARELLGIEGAPRSASSTEGAEQMNQEAVGFGES